MAKPPQAETGAINYLLPMPSAAENRRQTPDPAAFVTLGGLPLRFELEWPFHKSTSGADLHVLHGTIHLLSDPSAGLRADFAANFSQVMVQVLPSLAPEHAESVAINAVRLAADAGRLEFLKSGKRLPIEVSSRRMNFKTGKVYFLEADPGQLQDFLKKKLFWLGLRSRKPDARLWLADPWDCQYLGVLPDALFHSAQGLGGGGYCRLEGEFAVPGPKLAQEQEYFTAELKKTLDHAVAKFNQALAG